MNPRRQAIFILSQWMETGAFPNRLIKETDNHALVTNLVYTTLRYLRTLEWVVRKFVRKMPGGETGSALLIGSAQLLFMPGMAPYAAVNESVAAAKIASSRSAALVNGVLRNIARQKQTILDNIAKQSEGIRLSHPDILLKRWQREFGKEQTAAICEWNNQPATTYLSYAREAQELEPCFHPLPRGQRVDSMAGFYEGEFIVQNPATALSIRLLDVQPGIKVLDACAAPGGKTVQIAWRMGKPLVPGHRLTSVDLHNDRINLLRETLSRTRLDWVNIRQGDLCETPLATLEPGVLYDRILLDAPCTNTGVLQRRPDARWRWSTKRLQQLVVTQQKMLTNLLPLVAPNGRLVYSTCSLEPEENQMQIEKALQEFPAFVCQEMTTIIPGLSGTDGAFACALQRL